MRSWISLVVGTLLLAGPLAAGCSAGRTGDADRTIVAAFYPLQYVAERLAGDAARTVNLVRPGVEPHEMELTPTQLAKITEADLVVHLKGFQPAVDEAVEQHVEPERAFDVGAVRAPAGRGPAPRDTGHTADGSAGEGHGHHGSEDPHVWLDPRRYAAVGRALAAKLADVDPDRADRYAERARTFADDLAELDQAYRKGLADCARRELVVSHAAFGHLAAAYRLRQVPIAGLSPEQEPTTRRLAEVATFARRHEVRVIFFETLVSDEVARTLAREVGADARVLDPIEGLRSGSDDDYFSVMRRNLGALRTALECA